MNNLYRFGIEGVYFQFLYYQKKRVKTISNRALHYILSFDSENYEADIDRTKIMNIMSWINYSFFTEYQRICFLHENKHSHIHIHWVINPVNMNNLSICRINFYWLQSQIAKVLAECDIALQPITYQNPKGGIVYGNESGAMLYQKKYYQRYGLQ